MITPSRYFGKIKITPSRSLYSRLTIYYLGILTIVRYILLDFFPYFVLLRNTSVCKEI